MLRNDETSTLTLPDVSTPIIEPQVTINLETASIPHSTEMTTENKAISSERDLLSSSTPRNEITTPEVTPVDEAAHKVIDSLDLATQQLESFSKKLIDSANDTTKKNISDAVQSLHDFSHKEHKAAIKSDNKTNDLFSRKNMLIAGAGAITFGLFAFQAVKFLSGNKDISHTPKLK